MRKYERVYKDLGYGKELVAYKSNDVLIEIYNYDITANGNFHKDYIVPKLKELGYASRFETLKEAKEYIERYI